VKIGEFLKRPMVIPSLAAENKEEVLRELASYLCRHCDDIHVSPDSIQQALLYREQLGSTGVGEGVAIPHAKFPGLRSIVACFGRSSGGIVFDAMDKRPVHLFFVLLVPEHSAGMHLKALARVARLLRHEEFRERLLKLPDGPSLYDAFLDEDSKY